MKHYTDGYSLVEVLVSVALIGTLASLTLPNLSRVAAQNRLDSSMYTILKTMHLARAVAVSNSTYVTTCPLISGSCTKSWNNKIFTFNDLNANLSLDENEQIIKVLDKININDELSYPRQAITYRPNGSISFMQSGSFIYCNKTYPRLTGNQITVSQVGRVRIRDSDRCTTPDL
ncbi:MULTISPECIES: GspH/FimT family pseudopilin [Pseudoalteromonas]|uniref:GspH/FimT family pseudopilin n=1 Tax=Pseudoalteromonas TaxID=53246 RepID=UPI00026C90EF|nr:GspH/FimT family pseudopilin [Pseudoalteromonas spongiae]